MSVSFFLPARSGSQRVLNKNTRPFAGFNYGLLENKLRQLMQSAELDEVVLSTNDATCIEVGRMFEKEFSRLRIDIRPDWLCLDTTNLQDLIRYVPSVIKTEHILWGHVTTPLINGPDYDKGINAYRQAVLAGFDSLISVMEIKNFILSNAAELINNNTNIPWPRTQDLAPLFEVNHAMFLAPRTMYEETANRVGAKPFLFVMDKLKSVDVDWEEDFKIAELLYGIAS